MGMTSAMRRFIREHRRSRLVGMGALMAEKYLRAYMNEDFWDLELNGERFVLSEVAAWAAQRSINIWDVGAHRGGWALAAHEVVPRARITAFEIVPETFEQLRSLASANPWLDAHNVGLSAQGGTVVVHWNRDHDSTSSITPRANHRLFAGHVDPVTCRVTTGDEVSHATGIVPQVIKIDVEGHEMSVLRGMEAMLGSSDATVMIQFEYGSTWLPAGATLDSAYRLLNDLGFDVGRLYPEHVEFRTYGVEDDHFRMGNYIAVRDRRLRAQLLA